MPIDFNAATGPTEHGIKVQSNSVHAAVPAPINPFDIEAAKAELSVHLEAIEGMLAEAKAFEITDELTNNTAVQMGLQAKKLAKRIKDAGAEKTKEHRAFTGAVRNWVRVYTDMLDSIESDLKGKFREYSRLQEMKRREDERKAQEAARELQKKINAEAKKKKIDPIHIPEPALPQKQAPTRTEEGSGSIKKVWTFEVEDWTKVDRNHLEAIAIVAMEMRPKKTEHHPVIRKVFMPMVTAGVRSIPGIRIFQDDVPVWRG